MGRLVISRPISIGGPMHPDIFGTGDTHFLHENIVELSNRPFENYKHMEEVIVTNWNSVVKPGDIVIHVGDFALTWKKADAEKVDKLLSYLNGNKFLVIGNHDRDPVIKNPRWTKVAHYHEIRVDMGGEHKQRICFNHYAQRVWNQMHRGAWMLYGHSHNNLPDIGGWTRDIGVDAANYKPLNIRTEIKEFMDARPMLVGEDHHN
jgi:calcineurin-like phosphoesterase family protein